ncbi:MAG: hypothetical protein AVDCRST_MAG67-2182 [uncultured Solirubrobacteraceae bacterium]|uniref:DUF2231 domain-containing protein n=1 Tax=uncultured Solirubrobacteraceae bacterium TaxID=1162706 RepID=A0A6J4S7N1_9ACTN|nr:MAG: hypothetical protein AVDCRST_MAG67-2182 [uncultured Solirubrobacteraceae bacterium]
MSSLVSLVKGFPGKPSHAPLTDVSVGAYTVGVAMLVVGALGFEQEAMAKGGLLAISGGLIVAVPTSLTGLLDWSDLAKGTAKRKIANVHLAVMLAGTAVFAAAWFAQRPGYLEGEVTALGLLLGLVAFGLLVVGGTLGGALAYVYGVRVVKQDVSVADALIPGRIEEQAAASRHSQREVGVAPVEQPVAAPAGTDTSSDARGEPAEPEVSTRAHAASQAARYRL